MAIDDFDIHPKFRLNGILYTKVELKELAYDLVKEGRPFEKSIGTFLLDWLDEIPTMEAKTSGSTGKPKNILLQKQQMINSALATGEYFDLKEGSTALLCLPVNYIAGKMMLVRAMVLGLEVDYVEPSSSPLTELSKTYDFGAMVPLQLENSVEKVEMFKTLLVGGASVSRALQKRLQKTRTSVIETYGMTETISHIAARTINHHKVYSSSGVENSFKALPKVSFSTDNRGCLLISAPKVSDDPVITNDIVHLISETEFEWLGRYDNVINSGGIKLYPEQIEAKLAPLLNNRFFVASLPDEKLGQQLVLVVEGQFDSEGLLLKIKKSDALEWFEVPKHVYVLMKFVDTETGKIRRKENLHQIEL